MKDWTGAARGELQRQADDAAFPRCGPAPASISPSRRISASVRLDRASTPAAPLGGVEVADRLRTAPASRRTSRSPWPSSCNCGSARRPAAPLAQPATHHAAKLGGSVVQRLAAHAQGRTPLRVVTMSVVWPAMPPVEIAGRLWQRDGVRLFARRPNQLGSTPTQAVLAYSRRTKSRTRLAEVIGRSRNTT